jgi:hypothetical protein
VQQLGRVGASRSRWTRAVLLGSSLAALALTTTPNAQAEATTRTATEELARIEVLIGAADFDQAEDLDRKLLATGRLTRAELARAHLELGIILSARGAHEDANRALRHALRLDGTLTLPDFAGPHVSAAFAESRAKVASDSMRAVVDLSTDPQLSTLRVRGHVVSDPDELARNVVVEGPGLRRVLAFVGEQRTLSEQLSVTSSVCQTFVAAVTDEYGNSIWPVAARLEACPQAVDAGQEAEARATPPVQPHRPTDAAASPERIPPQVWIAGALTGSLTLATVVLGVSALRVRSDYHASLDDPRRTTLFRLHLRERALDAEHHATLAGALAAAAGATTGLLYCFRARGAPAVSVAIRGGSAAVVAAARF